MIKPRGHFDLGEIEKDKLLQRRRNTHEFYNESGRKICTYKYDAWGECTVSVASGLTGDDFIMAHEYNPFRYRGYYYDSETGYYYLQTRYYNPEWGRFLNADSALYSHMIGFNMFAYCDNNPINYVDPVGENAAQALDEWYQYMPEISSIDGPYPVADLFWVAGFVILGFAVIVETIFVVDTVIDTVSDKTDEAPQVIIEEKEKYDPNPYKRPGEKKQNRENRNKSRQKKDWKPRNNRRSGKPVKPKKHTPGRDHKKYYFVGPKFFQIFPKGAIYEYMET